MYTVGQTVLMHPKLADLVCTDYNITTGKPVRGNNVIYFNALMRSLANKFVKVSGYHDLHDSVILIEDEENDRDWYVIQDWELPVTTFKEL